MISAKLSNRFEIARPLCWILLPFFAAALVMTQWGSAVLALSAISAGAAFLILGIFWRVPQVQKSLLLVGSGILAGTFLLCAQSAWLYQPALRLAETTQTVTASVEEITSYSWGTRYRLALRSPVSHGSVLLDCETPLSVSYGDVLSFSAELSLPQESWEDYQKSRGVYLEAELQEGSSVTLLQQGSGFLRWLRQQRDRLSAKLSRRFSEDTAAVLQGILLGDSQNMSDHLRFSYQNTGSFHYLAVSGMHLSTISALCFWVFGWFLREKARRIASLAVVWIFVLFSGCHLSAVRAAIMLTMVLLAGLFDRNGDGLISLSMAGALIVLVFPFSAGDLGFLMSFFATLGIYLISTPLISWIRRRVSSRAHRLRGRAVLALAKPLVTALGANLLLIPILAWSYGYYSLWTIPVSFLLEVLGTPILWLGMLLLPLFWLETVPHIFSDLLEFLVLLLNRCLSVLASKPEAILGMDAPALLIWSLLVFAIAIIWSLAPKPGTFLWGGAAITAALILALGFTAVTSSSQTTLYFAGDGVCADVIFLHGTSAVVLAGREDGYVHSQTYQLLRRHGVRTLEAVVLLRDKWESGEDYRWLTWSYTPTRVFVSPEHIQALAQDWAGTTAEALDETLSLSFFDEVFLSFEDSKTGWNAAIAWEGTSLLLTGSKASAEEFSGDILLLTGSTFYEDYRTAGYTVLALSSPWEGICPDWCVPVYSSGGKLQTKDGKLSYFAG